MVIDASGVEFDGERATVVANGADGGGINLNQCHATTLHAELNIR